MDESEAQRKRHLHPAAWAVAALGVSAAIAAGVILSRHPAPAPQAARPSTDQLLTDAATALRADGVTVVDRGSDTGLPIGAEAAIEVADGGGSSLAVPVQITYPAHGIEVRTVAWMVVTAGETPSTIPSPGRPPLPNRAEIPPLLPQPSISPIPPTPGESGEDVVLVRAISAQILVSTWAPISSP